MFRTGIHPSWEDPKNANGGEYRLQADLSEELLDKMWQEIVFFAIGENFLEGSEQSEAGDYNDHVH